MKIFIKSIIALLGIVFFIFLLLQVFFGNNLQQQKELFLSFSSDREIYLESKNNIVHETIQNTPYSLQYYNFIDNVIYGSGSIDIQENGLAIENGLYFFNTQNLISPLAINGNSLQIQPKAKGQFIIHQISPEKTIIFSLSNILSISFIHNASKKEITKTELYPHSYIIINPKKVSSLQNGDLLKISQMFQLGFFQDPIYPTQEVSETFLQFFGDDVNIHNTIKVAYKYALGQKKSAKNNIKLILETNQITRFKDEVSKKYHSFIKNEKKEILEKKNTILELFKNPSENKNQIKQLLKELKQIDNVEHDTIIGILWFYYYQIILGAQTDIALQQEYYDILYSLYESGEIPNIETSILIDSVYQSYDQNTDIDLLSEIYNFIVLYSQENNIDNSEAFLFYLQKLLSSNFSHKNIDIEQLSKILGQYNRNAETSSFHNQVSGIKTTLFQQSAIVVKILNYLNKKYFVESEQNNALLKRNNQKVGAISLHNIEKEIKILFDFYNKNKKILNIKNQNKDKNLSKIYEIYEKKSEELFFALKDYENYLIVYDPEKNKLLYQNTLEEKDTGLQLNQVSLKNYLGDFYGANMNNMKVQIHNYEYCSGIDEDIENMVSSFSGYCYDVEDFFIGSNKISFRLFPSEDYTMNNIFINEKQIDGEYILSDIKRQLQESQKNDPSNPNKYNFSYFFVNTFFNRNLNVTEKFIYEEENNSQEDSVIVVFKKNKLLGEKGDFKNIQSFTNISYDDLYVTRQDNNYITKIKTSFFKIKNSSSKYFYGYFSANYDFDKHSFLDIYIAPTNQNGELRLLEGSLIQIDGPIPIQNFSSVIQSIEPHITDVINIKNTASSIPGISNLEITFIEKSESFHFEYLYNNMNIKIVYADGNIPMVTKNKIRVNGGKIDIKELKNILLSIK